MGAFYDTYDYPAYWNERQYEHESEVICLRAFLQKIPKIDKIIDIGGGYGRLTPYYSFRAKKVVLNDPSSKLLSTAKNGLANLNNIDYVQSTIANLPSKFRRNSFDLVITVRVMHHLPDLEKAIEVISDLVAPGGYVILEFANKVHAKAVVSHLAKRDLGFTRDYRTIDVRSDKAKREKTIDFVNHHPHEVEEKLNMHNFTVIEKRSVSNIRSPFLKKHLPLSVLLSLEGILQRPFSYLNFGPSIFLLARKK